MFRLRQSLLSAVLCAALTASLQASAPESGATNSNSLTTRAVNPVIQQAIDDNKNNPCLTGHDLFYQEVFTHLFASGQTEQLSALLTTCHKMHDQLLLPGVNAAFRGILKAHPTAAILNPWKKGLFHRDANIQHLIWARQMLKPENIKRLGKEGLLGQLKSMTDKAKALALGASADKIFTEKMDEYNQLQIINDVVFLSLPFWAVDARTAVCKEHLFTKEMNGYNQTQIIETAFQSAHSVPKIATLSVACKQHLMTEGMSGIDQTHIIRAALQSSLPLFQYAARGAICRAHLFTENMGGYKQAWVIEAALALSDTQLTQLVRECHDRTWVDTDARYHFIIKRARTLQAKL